MSKSAAASSLTRHPLSAAYEDIYGPAWDDLVNDMRKWGLGKHKITLYEGQILDGWQRYRACLEAGIEPEFETFAERIAREDRPDGYGIDEFIAVVQEHRRSQTPEMQRARRINRIQRASEARERGDSIRTIAIAEKVSPTQVYKDLKSAEETSGVNRVTPDTTPSTNGHSTNHVTGTDGKKYPKKKKPKGEKPAPSAKSKALKDDFGNLLPAKCRDAFADPFLQEAFDTLTVVAEKLRKGFLADGMNKRKKAYPHIDADSFIHGIGMIDNCLEKLIDHLKTRRPAGVCQECEEGKGCAACGMSGLVPRETYLLQKGKK